MAENAISRRKLICHAPALIAVGVAAPALGTELSNKDNQDWKDRLALAALELRKTTTTAHSLLDEAKRVGKFDINEPGFCPEYRAYNAANSRQKDAETRLDKVIFEGVEA